MRDAVKREAIRRMCLGVWICWTWTDEEGKAVGRQISRSGNGSAAHRAVCFGRVSRIGARPGLSVQPYRVEERANWKVVLNAQNELYHLPYLHRQTLGNVFAKNELSQSRFKDFTIYGPHNSWSAEYGRFQKLTP